MILLVGNWKMAPEKSIQAGELAKKIASVARAYKDSFHTIICAPFIHIPAVTKVIKHSLAYVSVGAQNVSHTSIVANTGLISAGMLRDYGVRYSIVGHSEARARSENNDCVKDQIQRLVEKKIVPILCVGEKTRDAHGWYLSLVKDQVESALTNVPKNMIKQIIIAYEPVWAIGENALREATPAECNEMIIFIRKLIADMYGEKTAQSVRVIYGGSVHEGNARSFIVEGNAQGFLVGRCSLEPKRFLQIAKSIVHI